MRPIQSFFAEKEEISMQQGFKAVEALGLVIHTLVMLNEETGCTTQHPKFRNCPFCHSIGQLYRQCTYDDCPVPYYDGSIMGNKKQYYIPWKTAHGCIVNPCLLASAFGHLPQPYKWDEDEDTGLDFTLQWSGPKPQHLLHGTLTPQNIQDLLIKCCNEQCDETNNPMAKLNPTEQLLQHLVAENWAQAMKHYLQHHAMIDPNEQFGHLQFISHQDDERFLPNVGGTV